LSIQISQQARDLLLDIATCNTFCNFRAQNDLDIPCQKILFDQVEQGITDRQLPIPWHGDIEKAPILFVSSNPGIDSKEYHASLSWINNENGIEDFYVNRFEPDRQWTRKGLYIRLLPETPITYRKYWTRYWATTWKLTKLILQTENIMPGRHCAITEIVHCKSNGERGVEEAKDECVKRYLNRIFNLASAKIIVLLGKHATEIMSKEYKLNIVVATEKKAALNHSTITHIGNIERLVVAIPAPNNRGTRGLTWLKQSEKDNLFKWGKKAVVDL
jgi:uracil-DNA glycosylase